MMRSTTTRTLLRCLKQRSSWPARGRALQTSCSSCRSAGIISPGSRSMSGVPFLSSDNILRSPFPDEDIPNINFAQYFMNETKDFQDLTAMVDYPTGRSYTYAQLKGASLKIASALTRLGYKKGDVLAIVSANIPEYSMVILAAAWCGITVTPANPAYTPGELARQLEMAGARGVFIMEPLIPVLQAALSSSPILQKNIKDLLVFGQSEGYRPLSELLKDDGSALPQNVDVNPKEDVLLLPFSSGTTGLPKGVMITHHNCVANLRQCKKPLPVKSGEDNLLAVLPFFHIYGMIPVQFGSLAGGGTLYTVPRFEPEMFLKCLHKHKISLLHVVPPIILFLAKHPVVSKFDLSNLKQVVSGAAPLGEGLVKELEKRLHIPVFQGYGLTECSPVVNIDVKPTRPGSIGYVVPNTDVKIQCPETGKTLSPGELGEYCVKGPQVMKGYLNDANATAEMLDSDNWLHTGDLGLILDDGRVVIEDRLKELIKYKGFQVPPAELEAFLLTHPKIQDVGVIGVPEEGVGELPRAYVVKKPDAQVTEEEIAKFVEDNLATYKCLRGGVVFTDEIPKSPSGKILRRLLKENIA